MDDDIEYSDPEITPFDAVRVTPHGPDGPDHARAQTWHLETPALFAYIHRRRYGILDDVARPATTNLPGLVAFIAPAFHPQEAELRAIDAALDHEPGASLEIWFNVPGVVGSQGRMLVPNWRHADPDDWTAPDSTSVHATGLALPARTSYAWPDASHHGVSEGTVVHAAVDAGPPPPAGPATTAKR